MTNWYNNSVSKRACTVTKMGTKPMKTFLFNILASAHNNGAVVQIHNIDSEYFESTIIVHDDTQITECMDSHTIEAICVGTRGNRVPMTESAIRDTIASARLVEIHTFEMGVNAIVANGTKMWING